MCLARSWRRDVRSRKAELIKNDQGQVLGRFCFVVIRRRAADLGRRQSAPLRPRERAAVVILRRVAAGVGDRIAAVRRQQVAPRAVVPQSAPRTERR